MIRIVIFILLIVSAFNLNAQTKTVLPPVGGSNTLYRIGGALFADSVMLFPSTSGVPTIDMTNYRAVKRLGAIALDSTNNIWYGYNPATNEWDAIGGGGSGIIAGGAFTTSNIGVGFNPCVNCTVDSIIKKVFYGLKPPTAELTGGETLELTAASTVSKTLAWQAGRQSNTPTLLSVTVAGISQSFSQPAQPGSVGSNQAVSVPANTTTVYSNAVIASDGQFATATTTFNFLGKKYYGWISDTTGIGAGTQDAAILALTSAFASAKALSVNTGSPTGTQFYVYAYPASLGALTGFSFNSIPAIEAMNTVTKSFTNSLGYTQSYIFYWNKQGQTTSSDISAQ